MICVQTLRVLATYASSRIMTRNSEKIVRYSFWGVSCDILHLWFLKTWTKDKIKTTNLLSTVWHHAANCDGIFIRNSFTQWIADSCTLISLIYTTWGIKIFLANWCKMFSQNSTQPTPHGDQVYPGIMFWTNLNLRYLWKSRHKFQVFCLAGFSEEIMLSYQHISNNSKCWFF